MNPPRPTASHPWLSGYQRPRLTPEQARELSASSKALRDAFNQSDASSGLHGFRVTHRLYDATDGLVGELYCFRGAYHTLEQWTHGEPGLTRKDLREGETLVRV